jgi:predicted RND superfamily exporter protein
MVVEKMKIHVKLLILITITFTLLSVSFASNCTSESDNLKMISGEDNSIITSDALKLDCNNNLNSQYLKENNEVETEKKDIKKTDNPQSFNITSNNINQTFISHLHYKPVFNYF